MPHTTDPLTGLKRRTLPLVVFAVSFLITVLCFILVALNQNRALNMNLNSFANHQTLSLEAFIGNDVAYIGSGANFSIPMIPRTGINSTALLNKPLTIQRV